MNKLKSLLLKRTKLKHYLVQGRIPFSIYKKELLRLNNEIKKIEKKEAYLKHKRESFNIRLIDKFH